ncbi:Rhodanese-like domain-containing protein [Cladochytrium replicatum]|nr:Rhodanese-like domain-containing protein [Cladochytrium replicatum]
MFAIRTLIHGAAGLTIPTVTTRSFTIIPASKVAETIRDKHSQLGTDYVILDVRDPEEFAKSHLPGAVNLPHEHVLRGPQRISDPQAVLQSATGVGKGKIFVHCNLSLIRGPEMARWVEEVGGVEGEVCVVEGGFKGWTREYPDLVERD